MDKEVDALNNMAFDGHGPKHRRRLRPNRGPLNGDHNRDLDNGYWDATDALPNGAINEIVLPIPFTLTSCAMNCQQQKKEILCSSISMRHCNMQGATTVEWVFYASATHVARLTRISLQHNVTFQNAKGPLRGGQNCILRDMQANH